MQKEAKLEKILEEIEKNLKEKFTQVYSELQDGASKDQLKAFENIFNGEVPHELKIFYVWHNGQDGYSSFNQKDNFIFLSIDEVINAYEFLNDPMEEVCQPYVKSWIPIFYNGGGDYLMYEIKGKSKGKFLTYYHDDTTRKIKYENLEELLMKALESMN